MPGDTSIYSLASQHQRTDAYAANSVPFPDSGTPGAEAGIDQQKCTITPLMLNLSRLSAGFQVNLL